MRELGQSLGYGRLKVRIPVAFEVDKNRWNQGTRLEELDPRDKALRGHSVDETAGLEGDFQGGGAVGSQRRGRSKLKTCGKRSWKWKGESAALRIIQGWISRWKAKQESGRG